MNLTESTVKLFGSRIAGMAVNFAGLTYFARELGAFQIGVFFLFQALLNVSTLVADLGLRSAIEKRISEGSSVGEVFTTGVGIKLVPVSAVMVVTLLVGQYINEYIGMEVTWVLVIAILAHELAYLPVQTLNGELRVGETATLLFARRVTWVGLGAVLVTLGYSTLGLIYALIGSYVVLGTWGFIKSSASLARPSKETARSLFDFAKFSAVNAAGWRIFSWIDVLVIGLFLTQNFVGAYEIAWKVTSMTMMLAASIRTVIFPQISSWDAEGKVDDIESLLPKLLLGSLFFVIPAFFGSLVLSRNILVTVFGEGYGIVALAMSVLMLQKVVQATSAVVGQSLQAVDQPKLVAIAMVIGATTNIVMNVLLITQFGVVGAAVATFTSYTLMTILQVQYLSQFVSITVPAAELGWCTVASVVMVGAVYLVKASFGIGNISKLIATIVFGAFVYLAIIALNPAIRIKIANNVDAVVGQP